MSPPLRVPSLEPRRYCEECVEGEELAVVLRNLRYLAPFARPHRLPKWSARRSYRIWSIAWRYRLPAPRRAPAIERIPAPRRPSR